MKMKKRAEGWGFGTLITLLLAVVVMSVVIGIVGNPLQASEETIIKAVPKQGCKSFAEYPDLIKASYNASKHQEGFELYVEFKTCYPGKKLEGIPEEIILFYELEQAKLFFKRGEIDDAKELCYELLSSYQNILNTKSSNATIAAVAVEKINEIYDLMISIERQAQPANKQSIAVKIEEKKAVLLNLYNKFSSSAAHKVPLDLILIYIGDTYLSTTYDLGKDYYGESFRYYAEAVIKYPKEQPATGQGLHAKKAEDKIIELSQILRDEDRPEDATELCYWLNENYISENGKTRSENCLDIFYNRLLCDANIWTGEKWINYTITSCSDYKQEFTCLSDKCDVNNGKNLCTWINSKCQLSTSCTSIISCADYKNKIYCKYNPCKKGACVWTGKICIEQAPPSVPSA